MIENYVEKQGNNSNKGYIFHMTMARNNIHIRNITLQVAKNSNGIKMERPRQKTDDCERSTPNQLGVKEFCLITNNINFFFWF
jgi:hypothetical protein